MTLEKIEAWAPQWLSIVRIVTALVYMEHGTAKLFHFPTALTGLPTLLIVQGVIEVVGGILLTLGLFTRPVAFILGGDMAVAYFMSHWPKSFFPMLSGGDPAVLFTFIFLYFFFAGGGAWSIDALRRKAG